jgi:hypothetical protein
MIFTNGPWFKDEANRTLMLRGVNLGGSSKVPLTPNGASYRMEGFFDTKKVSFVGRPFPLDEADEHFSRLRAWGFNFLRFLITWEAVEHAGPGVYDEEYLEYLYAIVKKAGEYGFNLFIDPHQDVWSRFSGGDGAPGWTFDILGMDIAKFKGTGAAIVHQTNGDPYPRMIWISNNYKYAAATLYTLFFAGNDFAPECKINGQPVQEFLQGHYINAMQQVVKKLKDLPNVIGYDTLNEPSSGYVGVPDLREKIGKIKMGVFPTPWQSLQLASGFTQTVDVLKRDIWGLRKIGEETVNPQKVSLFNEGYSCVWRQAGIWEIDTSGQPVLLKPNYFNEINGKIVNFNQDYFIPFVQRYTKMVRDIEKDAMIFIETVPDTHSPEHAAGELANSVYASHWYDGLTLVLKTYIPFLSFDNETEKLLIGNRSIRKGFAKLLNLSKKEARERMGNIPSLIGEVGIPFDLNEKKAYRTGNFSDQEKALDRSLTALEDNLHSYTLWNYTSDNTNLHGDMWNDEDLSLFSRDQQKDPTDINSGGRAVKTFVRPYPTKTAGEPTKLEFNYRSGDFLFEFKGDRSTTAPTEIFLPKLHYRNGCRVVLSDGSYTIESEKQLLLYTLGELSEHRIQIKRK